MKTLAIQPLIEQILTLETAAFSDLLNELCEIAQQHANQAFKQQQSQIGGHWNACSWHLEQASHELSLAVQALNTTNDRKDISMSQDKRSARAQMAEATVTIINSGQYDAPSGKCVNIAREIAECNAQTRLFTPDYIAEFSPQSYQTVLEVQDETTLQGANRLVALGQFAKVGVLNFASAKNAGGGFLGGSQAQEESLARSSALYGSLQQCPAYYYYHRNIDNSLLYSDHVIYSPHCMVFRNDQGTLLEQAYAVDFITSPAPNKGALARNEAHNLKHIPATLSRRIEHFLRIAAEQGCDALVLGAWGCGVFANDPDEVAAAFAEHLQNNGRFAQQFKRVSFSIPFNAKTADNTHAFRKYFA